MFLKNINKQFKDVRGYYIPIKFRFKIQKLKESGCWVVFQVEFKSNNIGAPVAQSVSVRYLYNNIDICYFIYYSPITREFERHCSKLRQAKYNKDLPQGWNRACHGNQYITLNLTTQSRETGQICRNICLGATWMGWPSQPSSYQTRLPALTLRAISSATERHLSFLWNSMEQKGKGPEKDQRGEGD